MKTRPSSSWLIFASVPAILSVFDSFHSQICKELLTLPSINKLLRMYGDDFDAHVANEILGRGQTHGGTRFLASLYAYRYAPMHFAALRAVLPESTDDVGVIDFGAGPGTALLAAHAAGHRAVHHVALEIANGMKLILEDAQIALGSKLEGAQCHDFPAFKFWQDAKRATRRSKSFFTFSYFFGQDMTAPFVKGLAAEVKIASGTDSNVVYTNPVGPHASWMPRDDIHHWYKLFCSELGHTPYIQSVSYSYRTCANLGETVERRGECAYEIWSLG